VVFLGLLAFAPAARADDIAALYHAEWAGMPAGHIRLILHETADGYRNEIAINSEGFPRLVIRFRGTAVAEGKFAGAATVPARFDADYDLRKQKDKRLRMAFARTGGSLVAERGAADTSQKPPLAEKFRRDVIDPLSVLTLLRRALIHGDTALTIPVYDGARRFDTMVKVLPRDPKEPGVRLALSLKAIAGFKGGEDGDPDDAPRPVAAVFSDDKWLMPLRMKVPIWFLPLEVRLVRYCTAAQPCPW
jgi:uncharacterized protein DUF3108